MKPTSISQTMEQFFNAALTITFVYSLVGTDPWVMAAGGNLATTLAIMMSFSYLMLYYRRKRQGLILGIEEQKTDETTANKKTRTLVRGILAVSIPLTLSSLIAVVNNVIDTVTISNLVQTAYEGIIVGKEALETRAMELAGVLSKVETIMRLPLALNAAFAIALVPAVSGLMAKNDVETSSKRVSFSFFLSILIIFPCAVGLSVLAKPILEMLYPAASGGAGILALTTITMVFIALNYVVNGGLYGLRQNENPCNSASRRGNG